MRHNGIFLNKIIQILFLLFSVCEITKCDNVTIKEEAKRTNFIIFFGDDWAWGDLGANWPKSKGLTPNLDKLASQGLRFTDFHAGASVCTPSRAALLTGRLGLRTGVVSNFGDASNFGLPLTEITLAEFLKQAGYRTGMIGKWHLGTTKNYHPIARGFDFYVGIPYSNDMGCGATPTITMAPLNREKTSLCPRCQKDGELPPICPSDPSCGRGNGCFMDNGIPLFYNTTIKEQPLDLDTTSDKYIEAAKTFITNAASAKEPFFLYYAASHMHVPQNHAARWENKTDRGAFGSALLEMDNEVGELMDSLDNLNLNDDTLFLVTGDNGPWECKCDLTGLPGPYTGSWGKPGGSGQIVGSTGKMTLWEGGHRQVGLVRWIGRITPRVSDVLASTLDFFPTLAAIADLQLPSDRIYDGIDLSPVLFEHDGANGHSTLFHPLSGGCGEGPLEAMRLHNFKAMWKTGGVTDCGGQNAACITHSPPLLFDLSKDPAESTALNTSLPLYKAVVAEMEEGLKKINKNISDTFRSFADYSNGPAGRAANCCNSSNIACGCGDWQDVENGPEAVKW